MAAGENGLLGVELRLLESDGGLSLRLRNRVSMRCGTGVSDGPTVYDNRYDNAGDEWWWML